MATDRDLSALLPPTPPARPDRREAAIGAALHRFDGTPAPARDAVPARRWSGRPLFGTLAAAALVAVVGLPIWLSGDHTPVPQRTEPVAQPTATTPAAPPPAETAEAAAEPAAEAVAGQEREKAASTNRPPPAPTLSQATVTKPAAEPVPAAEPPAAMLAAPAPVAAPPAPPAVSMARADDVSAAEEIVVTGARLANRAAKAEARRERRLAAPGAWNACTIEDPRRDPAACRKALPATAPMQRGRAATLVGDGLTRAWQGDLNGAITAFDAAVAAAPNDPLALLNRGLARARAGDDARALADFDKAIRRAPGDPRGWFQRSQILRRQGKIARADADAARAAELDPRYEDVVD